MLRRLVILALLAAVASGASAQGGRPYESRFDIPARPAGDLAVTDLTGTLSAAERDALARKLVAFADTAGSQVAVVLVPTTGGVAPVDYATEILREWGVGRAGIDDGVVLLVALNDREVFIATGLGAEGALTDATAGTIIRSVIVPRFRQGAFYEGIDEATDAILAALQGEFEPPAAGPVPLSGGGGGEGAIGSVLCCLLVLFVVLVVIASRQAPPPSSGGRRRGRRSGPGVIVLPGFGSGFGGGGFGGGGFGGGGFSGGFSGGFGGGFGGGGGAGGGW